MRSEAMRQSSVWRRKGIAHLAPLLARVNPMKASPAWLEAFRGSRPNMSSCRARIGEVEGETHGLAPKTTQVAGAPCSDPGICPIGAAMLIMKTAGWARDVRWVGSSQLDRVDAKRSFDRGKVRARSSYASGGRGAAKRIGVGATAA